MVMIIQGSFSFKGSIEYCVVSRLLPLKYSFLLFSQLFGGYSFLVVASG